MLQPMNRLDRPGLAVLILAVVIGLIGLITGNWLVAVVALLVSVSMVLRLRSLRGKTRTSVSRELGRRLGHHAFATGLASAYANPERYPPGGRCRHP